MRTQTIKKLALKIRNGCDRTSYIKSQAKKADFYLTANGLRDMEIEVEENCYSLVVDVLGSVIYGEV